MRQQVKDYNNHMQNQQPQTNHRPQEEKRSDSKVGDYIDFEEVK
jgi:hypothetical protein